MRGDPGSNGAVPPVPVMRQVSASELSSLCKGITTSFLHLETRDAYGTEVELPHMAKWRRGEPDDYQWLGWWLEMLRSHRQADRTCRRARVVSEPISEYQQWILSFVDRFVDAGEDIRYVPRPDLATVPLPGSGDFYVFDEKLVLFLHYAGNGTSASYQVTDDPAIIQTCLESFHAVWDRGRPANDYRSQ